jgi:vancomycin resistance protein YoaR
VAEVSPDSADRRAPWWRWPLAALLVLVAAYLILLLLAAGEVPRGTTVRGIAIGGLSAEDAATAVTDGLAEQAGAPIPLQADNAAASIDPVAAGLAVDADATVEAAVEPTFNPVTLVQRLVGSQEVEPVVTVDDEKLTAAVAAAVEKLDRPLVEGDLTFDDGAVAAVEPQSEIAVDADGTADAIVAAYLAEPPVAVVTAPAEIDQPVIDAAEVQRALTTWGRPAVADAVTVQTPGGRVVLTPTMITDALTADAVGARLEPVLDGEALRTAAEGRLAAVEVEPVDATFRIAGGKPVVVAAVTGRQVPADALADAVLGVLPLAADARVVRVAFVDSQPDLTTAEASALGVTEQVSTYTTRYPYAAYRLQNIHRAADLIDGTVLEPGETFSLNGIVGERTAANGFAEGIIINNGRFAKDFGGGVSQVATTTYNAMFFAGLEDVEHKAHTFYISRYPAGREATVAWPRVDLRFRNDSGNGIFIDTSYTRSTVTVTMWGTKVWQIESISGPRTNPRTPKTVTDSGEDCVPQDPVAGFDITVTRVFSKGGAEVKRESTTTKYKAADKVICRNPASAAPSPSPSPSTSPKPSASPSPSG